MTAHEVVAAALADQGAAFPRAGAMLVLAALKATGYAVVELPQPSDDADEGYTAQFHTGPDCAHVRLRWSNEIVTDGSWYQPDEARGVAAALLAAAQRAEEPHR